MLVRAESRNKFERRWFGPYRVHAVMLLSTYRLADPDGKIVATLINGQRLVSTRVTDHTRTRFWNSSKIQGALRRRGVTLDESSPEVTQLFEQESKDVMSYDELASISEKEWKSIERSGDVLNQVREGHNLSQPSAEELKALEEGLEEAIGQQEDITPTDIHQNNGNMDPQEDGTQISHTMETNNGYEQLPTPTLGAETEEEELVHHYEADTVEPIGHALARPKPSIWERQRQAALTTRDRVSTGYHLRKKIGREIQE